MAVKLLNDASFMLVRTNPLLTTNVKLTYTSDNEIYLNSINNSSELNKIDFKNYKTSSTSEYQWDLWRFWKKGLTPNNLTHGIGDIVDPTDIQNDYSLQYDLTYASGAKFENSKLYDEEFSFFAPLWLGKTLPSKFVIFRVNNPAEFEYSNIDEGNSIIRESAKDPKNFKKYMLDKATIIKTIDLGPETEIGKYIRKFLNSNDFPTQPINVRYEKDSFTQYSGVSVRKGNFSTESEKAHTNLVARDQTVIEFDNYVTKGFQRNGLAISNILNLEFLFDDPDAEDLSINRYFGFYVNDVPEGTETASGISPIDDYRISVQLENTVYNNTQIKDLASIFYLKDKKGKYYKIDADSNWDSNELVINEKFSRDDITLLGFSNPTFTTNAIRAELKGYSYIEMEIRDNPRSGDFYYLGKEDDNYLIIADHTIPTPGLNSEFYFNNDGTNEEIAESIVKAINYNFEFNQEIRAIRRENRVIVFSIFGGSRYNNRIVIRKSNIFNNSILITSNGGKFIGGSDNNINRIAISSNFEERLKSDNFYLLTTNGYEKIRVYRFLANPIRNAEGYIENFVNDDRFIITETESSQILMGELGEISYYTRNKNEYGFFSIFPVRDFDFDFHSTEYSSNDSNEMQKFYDNLKYQRDINETENLNDVSDLNRANLLKFDYENTFKRTGGFINLLGLENNNGELEKISSEYDRLQENNLKTLSIYSRVSPFVSKWVKKGLNTKELPYRLNTNFAFGLDNFSPSFEIKDPNPQYFTHEWYYLGAYPDYVDKKSESIKNYYQFFDNNFSLTEYLNPNQDYFTSYFTIEKKGDYFINPEIKFSSFRKGSRRNFAQTFFRGVKLYVKERRENNTRLNFNIENIEYNESSRYNDYKFSAVLQPVLHDYSLEYTETENEMPVDGRGLPLVNPGEAIPKLKFRIIENRKFKNILFLIDFKLPKSNLYKFYLDTIFLYTFKSIKLIRFKNPSNYNSFSQSSDFRDAIANDDYEFIYPDTPLTGIYDIRSEIRDNKFRRTIFEDTRKVSGIRSNENTFTNALKELTQNKKGKVSKIKLYNKGTREHVWEIRDILKVISDNVIIADNIGRIEDSANFPYEDTKSEIGFTNFTAKGLYPYYTNGGFNFFRRQVEDASFANIFQLVNEGSPEIEYITIPEDYDGTTPFEQLERDNFVIEFERPFSIQKSNYLETEIDKDIPPGLTTETNIGYNLISLNPTLIQMNRYGGDFFPKFRDVITFTDKNSEIEEYKNINREFDLNDTKFGYIENFYYAKVSPEASGRILSVSSDTGFKSEYPLIDEIGIDKKDFYIFSSNWDLGYYQKNINKSLSVPKYGTWNSLELKSFMASKVMSIPDQIRIEDFVTKSIDNTIAEEFDIEFSRPTQDSIEMEVFLEQRIILILFELGIGDVFDKYVNYEYTLQGNREDFISDYIRLNIFPRLTIRSVTYWVNNYEGDSPLPLMFNEISDAEKFRLGFRESVNFNYNTLRNSNLNFTLTGSLNTSKYNGFSTALTIVIGKR